MTRVRLENVWKRFGKTTALEGVDLDIQAGELFFLLGPSGCGKSTLLRLIAGLQEPSEGQIWFNDENVTHLPTQERNAVMCFQSYALWPHMTVRGNVRFGLSVRGMSGAEQAGRVEEVLKLVQMEALGDRRPNQLSGGQQQRVALARALAVRPRCLLLDEPLSNLDAKLRQEMRQEIRRICKSGEFTTVYVTHDQKEALSVADRIGLLKEGRLIQVGTPGDLYHRPKTSWVADFIGQTNLLKGRVVERCPDGVKVQTAVGILVATGESGNRGETKWLDGNVMVSVRPEQMRLVRGQAENGTNGKAAAGSAVTRVWGRVVESTFLGEASEHVVQVEGQRLRVICAPPMFGLDGKVTVEFDAADAVLLAD